MKLALLASCNGPQWCIYVQARKQLTYICMIYASYGRNTACRYLQAEHVCACEQSNRQTERRPAAVQEAVSKQGQEKYWTRIPLAKICPMV